MIRSLLKLGLTLVVAILVYNYFFGTDSEKENSRKIFGQVRDVVVSVGQLVKSEKQKFDSGKYDAALEKLGGAYKAVREQAKHLDASMLKRLDELEQRKSNLQQELDAIEQNDKTLSAAPPPPSKGKASKEQEEYAAKSADQQRRKEALQRELDQLLKDSDALLQSAQQQ